MAGSGLAGFASWLALWEFSHAWKHRNLWRIAYGGAWAGMAWNVSVITWVVYHAPFIPVTNIALQYVVSQTVMLVCLLFVLAHKWEIRGQEVSQRKEK